MLASNTERLDLLKKDPSVDGDDTFNIDTMLNENWDRIDKKVAMVDEDGKVVNKDGSPTGEVLSVNDKKGNVQLGKKDVGLENIENYGLATQSEAESGTSNTKYMTPQRTKQAIEKLSPEGVSEQVVDDKISTHAEETDVHGLRESSVILGSGARITAGAKGIAIGDSASTDYVSVSIGTSALAITSGVALGYQTVSYSQNGIAIGSQALTERPSSGGSDSPIAIGKNAITQEIDGIAIGSGATSGGISSIAIGKNAKALNAGQGMLGDTNAETIQSWLVPGSLTVNGTKNFEMPHPHPDKRETHRLRHSAVESPTAGDNLYRFNIEATKDGETVELGLPDYFEHLNVVVDVWVNGVDHFGNAFGKVEGNTLKVTCELVGGYNVLVIGTRNDDHQSVQDWDIMGVEREIGESWTGETYVFEVDEILEIEEIKEEDVA